MMMVGRKLSTASGYRFGFNGKENDNEVKGIEGSQQDYGMRIYDPRLGRFLSVDPIIGEYPELTPYQFANDNPIAFIDRDGLEAATYKLLDMAKRLYSIVKTDIVSTKAILEKTTDKKLKKELEVHLKKQQDNLSRIILFQYKHRQSKSEVILEHIFETEADMLPILELTPVGDLYTVITGENFKGDKKSRILAGVSILPWAKLGIVGKTAAKMLSKAKTGAGKELLEPVIKKMDNISKALDEKHITAAVGDVLGNPIVINGKKYDHLMEVENNLRGLGNQIQKIDDLIANNKLTDDVLVAAKEIRSKMQKQKDTITDVLNRTKNEVKKNP